MAQLTAAQQQMNAMIAFAMQQEKALQELDASDGDDEEEAVPMAEPATEPEDEDRLVCDGNRETMNIEQRLYRNICLSKYYQELEACTTFEEVLAEAQTAVTFIAAWFGNADGYVGEGSPAYCLLLRLHALPVTRPQLDLLLQSPNVYCRCLGLLYLRYTRFRDPGLYYRFEKAFRDTTRVTLDHRGTEFTTVGELALNLLKKLRFLGTMLPRVPVEAANRLETLLGVSLEDAAPLQALKGARKRDRDAAAEAKAPAPAAAADSDSDSDLPRRRFRAKFNPSGAGKARSKELGTMLSQLEPEESYRDQWRERQKKREEAARLKEQPRSPSPPPRAKPKDAKDGGLAFKESLDNIKKLYETTADEAAAQEAKQRMSKRALAKKNSLAEEVLRY